MNPSDGGTPTNPYANSGVSPNLGRNNSMRHVQSQVVGVNIAQAPNSMVSDKKDSSGAAGRTIALVVACLTASIAIIVMVSIFVKWQRLEDNNEIETKIAVEAAKLEQQQEDNASYVEKDKEPWRLFEAVPDSLGAIQFKYPKNWSVYVQRSGYDGNGFEAYFRPSEVLPTSDSSSRYALRMTIEFKSYDDVISKYDEMKDAFKEDEENSFELKSVGSVESYTSDQSMLYEGTLTEDGSISGSVAVLKVNNTTVTLQTDSELYRDDFYKLLGTLVRGNQL